MYRVSRIYTAFPSTLFLLAASAALSPVFAEENAAPGAKSTTLPPVEVLQNKPGKKPAMVKKKVPVSTGSAAQALTTGSDAAGLLGAEKLPGRGDLSPQPRLCPRRARQSMRGGWNSLRSEPTETSSAHCPVSTCRTTGKARLAMVWRCAAIPTRSTAAILLISSTACR